MQQSLAETLGALAELALGIGLPDHAQEMRTAAQSNGPIVTVPGLGMASTGLILWLLSRDASECFAELLTAGEAVTYVLKDRRPDDLDLLSAKLIVEKISELNVATMPASDLLKRQVAA